jgi:hypothetical protein
MINAIGSSTGDGTADYEELKSSGAGNAVWANDTLSFRKKLISDLSLSRGDDTITTADFNVNTISGYQKWEHFRNNFSRIIIANLGTLKITWAGYDNTRAGTGTPVGGEENISISDLEAVNGLKEYKFSSALFKSSPDGNNVFDWKNPTNNFVTNLRASFDNSVFSANVLYNLNKVLGIFIPINSWNIREIEMVSPGNIYYERIFYYPYAKRVIEFNVIDFTQQYPGSNPNVWQAALYPRIIQQRMYSVDTQNLSISSTYKIYEALWNVDVAVYPVSSGNCNNLAGDLLISYM